MEGSSNYDRAVWMALAISAGVAAGTAAAVTVSAFPYAFGAAFTAFKSKRKKESRDHRYRYKSDKTKRSSAKPKENQAYRDAVRRCLLEWKDINISLDEFPYFLNESTKTVLLDSMYVFLKKPEFSKYTNELGSVSPRILLTGPLGSEIYQEKLVKGLAQHLQVNILVFDSTRVFLEASQAVPAVMERVAEDSSVANQHSADAPTIQLLDGLNGDIKETTGVHTRPAIQETRSSETSCKILRTTSSTGPTKDSGPEGSSLGPLAPLRTKTKGDPNVDAKTLANAVAAAAAASATSVESRRSLKKGDRVKYIGVSSSGLAGGLALISHSPTSGRGPSIGSKGRVLMVLEDNPNKVGVRFEKPVYGGNNLVDLCEDGHGYFCNVSELRLEPPGEDIDKLILESLFDILKTEAQKDPLILFIRNVEKSILGNFERYMKLETLKDLRLVVIGSHTSDQQKEKGSASSSTSTKVGNNVTALLDLSFLDHLASRMEDYKGDGSKASKMLFKLFPTKIHLQQPQVSEEALLADWSRQLELDAEELKAEANRQQLRMVMGASGVECDDLASIDIRTYLLTKEMSEKVVGWGVSHHLQNQAEPVLRNKKLVIDAQSLQHSLTELQSVQRSPARKKSLKDVVTENEFEKMLLPEVIPPDELGVTFDHIGALDNVKETLRELVMLPLQRPELFVKGQLTKPCRGLLLFGPPGTGKTMLAKAVATEAGANFINISMSTIASKWFGEAEKYVKAVFTLASKISPSVIFIDEVDSMLGRRGKDSEHSAMRKLKNEFMASWDGLRTRERERVLVLAATNRPFDLDEAVIRRFPRRLMIDLPDADQRVKIMKVIFSLCTTAAYRRIRELLDQEKKDKESAKAAGVEPPQVEAGVTPYIRPLSMADMRQAMEKVRSSVASDAGSMLELQQWNEQYGEGGTRKKTTLSYFM
uniref:AAA+ ATPase domain-containing protein n=1 Tax=Physcomitrium patens TaxID=3218 RepID=A0A7I4CAX9_PHYPA